MVDGETFDIFTDFQFWINFLLKRKKKEIKKPEDFYFLFSSKVPKNAPLALDALCDFCDVRNPLPKKVGPSDNRIIFDYEIDSDLVFSAFWDCYGINLLDEKLHLHWYAFNALFDGLHDTKLNKVMEFRSYDKNDKSTYEQTSERLKQAWTIDIPLTEEEQKALDKFDALLDC